MKSDGCEQGIPPLGPMGAKGGSTYEVQWVGREASTNEVSRVIKGSILP